MPVANAAGATRDRADKCDVFLSRQLSDHTAKALSLVVKFSHKLGAAELAKVSELGGDIYRDLGVIESVAVRLRRDRITRFLALPFVVHASLDTTVKKTDLFTVGSSEADVAWQQYGVTGAGIGVAVIDSGVGKQYDFNTSNGSTLGGILSLGATRVKASVNFVPNQDGDDGCGHGTHVAGIIAGNGASSTGLTDTKTFYGIAKAANIISVKVLDSNGQGTVSQVIAGIQWCIANKAAYNIRVINLSLGHPVGESTLTDPLCQAVERAWRSGIVVVCAAGNDGRLNESATAGASNEGYDTNYGSIESPGNDPYVITVGAMKSIDGTRAHDRIATYSSRGPSRIDFVLKPDIVAPGNQVISVEQPNSYLTTNYTATNEVPYSYYQTLLTSNKSSNQYMRLSGTSMATPVISGAVAMMLQKSANLSPDTIKMRLMVSADKWVDPACIANPCTYGAGYINIPAALGNNMTATDYAVSPSLSFDQSGNVYLNMYGNVSLSRAIWGTNGLSDLRAIWGSRAIWGTGGNILRSSNAIWGKSVWFNSTTTTMTSDGVDLSAGSVAIQGEH